MNIIDLLCRLDKLHPIKQVRISITAMFEHQDVLAALNGKLPLPEKIAYVHGLLKERFDFIDRISVAIHDPKTDLLKTYLHSSDDENPLVLYSAKLADSESMQKILKVGRPRVVNDLDIFSNVPAEHTRRIASLQYKSSYTMPMFMNGKFFGFLFFNSHRKNVFDENGPSLSGYGRASAVVAGDQ